MIRFISMVLFLALFFIISIPLFLFLKVYEKINKEKADYMSLRIVQKALRGLLFLAGTKITVLGKENIPTDEPVLFVGNHKSYFDIVCTYIQSERLLGFVAKKEMEKIPFLRTWMYRVYCLMLDRENVRESLKTILQAIEYVKNGISIFIFPEGTRAKGEDEELLPFHAGSFKIAEKSGCKIIPVSINNTASIFEKQAPSVKASHVVIEYGTPIDPTTLSREEKKTLANDVANIISETVKKNKSLV